MLSYANMPQSIFYSFFYILEIKAQICYYYNEYLYVKIVSPKTERLITASSSES